MKTLILKKKNNETTERSYHKEYSCEISKLYKLLARLKFSPPKWVKLQGQGHCKKIMVPTDLSQGILMRNIKALALIVQKLLARLKFKKKKVKVTVIKNNGAHGKI